MSLSSLLEYESKADKIDGIMKRVKDYLSLGPHTGVKIDRKDAEVALYPTVAIIRYLAKRLQRP